MNYPLMFINNILSNVYIYQSWEYLGTMGVSSRTRVISAIYKKIIKKILQTTDPSHSSLDAIIFLLLDIRYIILRNGNFRNLKTNQLLSKKELYYTHFLLYVTLFTFNSLNEQLAVISLDSFSRVGLGFYFLCPSYVWLQKQIHPCCWSSNINPISKIQSKIKINGLLI